MSKILLWLSPITKYLALIGMIGAFVFGIGVTRMYYLGVINKQDAKIAQQNNDFLTKVLELDKQYVINLNSIRDKLTVTQRLLNEELKKPAYKCPIPDDGVRLLNDAINSRKPKDNSK